MDNNLKIYTNKAVVNWYSNLHDIIDIEDAIFKNYASILSTGDVLDIGIGGGRTTKYLINKCKNYVGIDYSNQFTNVVKSSFPTADIRNLDARNLSVFDSNTFDFVNFSFNGIDYVNLKDREQILSEINRVLKPNGIFFFSTHNKSYVSFNEEPWNNKRNLVFTRVKDFIKLAPFYFRKMLNRKLEVYENEYSIINDSAHNYGLMTFYTTPNFLIEQLENKRFCNVEFFSKKTKVVDFRRLDDWIFCTCQKSPS
jgi:ubiquinone/menaquinone biosynthesis C-methylase UbiE